MRLIAAAATAALVLIPVQGQAQQQRCVTAVVTCAMTSASTPGARCYCITPNGPVAGTVQGGSSRAPMPFNRMALSTAGPIEPSRD